MSLKEGLEKTAKDHDDHNLYLDLEIRNTVEQAGGWGSHHNMGVSVLCTWDKENGHQVFYEYELDDFMELAETVDKIIGFNHEGFDYPVIAGDGVDEHRLEQIPSLDMLSVINEKVGRRVSLEDMAKRNFMMGKNDKGELAPIKWQEGKRDEVIEYCQNDVDLTRFLHLFGEKFGFLMLPRDIAEEGQYSIDVW